MLYLVNFSFCLIQTEFSPTFLQDFQVLTDSLCYAYQFNPLLFLFLPKFH